MRRKSAQGFSPFLFLFPSSHVTTFAPLNLSHTGKGSFGQLVEKYYFGYEPNSVSEPDFGKVNLELKCSPLKQLKNKEYRAKERLVLNIINYIKEVDKTFETSSFWNKNANLLLIFYLHDRNLSLLDYIIKIVGEWTFPPIDLEIIKKDWEAIRQKIEDGRAHELSEGDTLYLGACTKGAKGGNPQRQPKNNQDAKQRAYSLKQGYVNHIIASLTNESEPDLYGKIIPSLQEIKKQSFEDIVIGKFSKYYGKTVQQINEELNVGLNPKAKNYYANLTKAILNVSFDKEIEEFEKADIKVKTVRMEENNQLRESISFPNFKFTEIIREEWEESDFKDILESKFLFIFFQFEGENLVLKKVKFWNMPHEDIMEAKKVWEKTIDVIQKGEIVRSVANGKRKTNFPDQEFSKISHVRPHAQNAADTYELPVPDKLTGTTDYTKHCFWLNSSYIREIFLKD